MLVPAVNEQCKISSIVQHMCFLLRLLSLSGSPPYVCTNQNQSCVLKAYFMTALKSEKGTS